MTAHFDGHLHTTCSDGSLDPEALVDAVAARGVAVMALTDHDTFAGHTRAEVRCRALGLSFVPGVEMSVSFVGREIHVLAYFVSREHPALAEALGRSREKRRAHLHKITARLASLGLALSVDEILAQAGDQSVGRPHVAKALVAKGYVKSVDEAFRRYLGDKKPGHVPREHISAETMIGLVNAAGGVASAAHPGIYGSSEADLRALAAMGLKGVECYHPEHSPQDTLYYLRACDQLGLVPTGGSDFHGFTDDAAVRPGSHGLGEAQFAALSAARG